jgi:hypothetical protein
MAGHTNGPLSAGRDAVREGRKTVGKYYAGPTWEASDGSKSLASRSQVAPAGTGNIRFSW